MQEIEVKAELKDHQAVLEKLKGLGCEISEPIVQKDRVFIHKDIGFKDITVGTPILRIREQGKKVIFTYKSIQGDELHKKEHEVEVSSASEMDAILKEVDYYEVVRFEKKRVGCKYKNIEICLDEVKDLGSFIEAEEMTDTKSAGEVQKELFRFLESVGVDSGDRVHKGYDVLMYNKVNGTDIKR